jgi:hypothetical protein
MVRADGGDATPAHALGVAHEQGLVRGLGRGDHRVEPVASRNAGERFEAPSFDRRLETVTGVPQ